MKNFILILLVCLFSINSFAVGKIQNEDVKSESDLVSAGSTKAHLINDSKVYVTANGLNDRLDNLIAAGAIGGGGGGGGVQLLSNPGFENGTSATGWTITTVTGANELSTVFAGSHSEKLTYSSQTGGIKQSVTPGSNTNNIQMEASCKVLTTMTTIEVCSLVSGSKVQCVAVPSSGNWSYVAASFVGPSNGTSVGVQVDTTSSGSGSVYVDDCYVGPSRLNGMSQIATDTVSYTPAVTGFGSLGAGTKMYWWRHGDRMHIHGVMQLGTVSGSNASFGLPSGYTVDTGKIPSAGAYARTGWAVKSSSNIGAIFSNSADGLTFFDGSDTSNLYITATSAGSGGQLNKQLGNSFATTGDYVNVDAEIPISGWTANANTYRADTTPASWSGYQIGPNSSSFWANSTSGTTFLDFSTGSSTLVQTSARNISAIVAANNLPSITATLPRAGNYYICVEPNIATGGNPEIGLRLVDGSNNVIHPGKYYTSINSETSPTVCGIYTASAAGAATFKLQETLDASVTSYIINVNSLVGGSAIQWSIVELDAPMPAPYLSGAVLSSSSGVEMHERAQIANNGTCSVSSQSGSWISSVSHAATGKCNLTFAAGEFSAVPTCVCTVDNTGGSTAATCSLSITSATAGSFLVNNSGAADLPVHLMCMGPH